MEWVLNSFIPRDSSCSKLYWWRSESFNFRSHLRVAVEWDLLYITLVNFKPTQNVWLQKQVAVFCHAWVEKTGGCNFICVSISWCLRLDSIIMYSIPEYCGQGICCCCCFIRLYFLNIVFHHYQVFFFNFWCGLLVMPSNMFFIWFMEILIFNNSALSLFKICFLAEFTTHISFSDFNICDFNCFPYSINLFFCFIIEVIACFFYQ